MMAIFKATNRNTPLMNALAMACLALCPVAIWQGYSSLAYLLGALLVWQWFNIVGLAAGMHRYFSHQSFETSRFWEWVMAYTAMVTLSGPPCIWADVHVKHHRVADTEDDPYRRFQVTGKSPLTHTTNVSRRFLQRMLARDRLHALSLRYYWLFVLSYPLAVALLAAAWGESPVLAVFWLFLVPAGATQLTLRFILWTGHIEGVGYRSFETRDTSNNWWFASLISGGEGWHNNHHARPGSPNMRVRWWELDPTWWFIRVIRK
jgi:fatty-acid desaturase